MGGPTHDGWFPAFANAFIPFGLMLAAALVVPEATEDLTYHRIVYTIWASTVLLIPAMSMYALPPPADGRRPLARWLWTFSYLAYLVHFYYAVWVHFAGPLDVLLGGFQHPGLAVVNYVLTVWWGLDVLLLWAVAPPGPKWFRIERAAVCVFLYVVFVGTEVWLKSGVVRVLGAVLAAAVPVSLLGRAFDPARVATAGAGPAGGAR
jgi:hypothetical protein